ncbi:Defective in cullin neddylation protein 1 [Apiospora marii]|uniref:Defective in cullin neddylation protein n=1 Tax=Apiospora marii TaxID=335849 RepID=A0ABR1R2C3_9PEZI
MPLSSAHRAAVAEFIGITGATEKVAQRFLKSSSYRMDEAVDSRSTELDAHFPSTVWSLSKSHNPPLFPSGISIPLISQSLRIRYNTGTMSHDWYTGRFTYGQRGPDFFYSSGASGGSAPSVSRESSLQKQFESLRDAQDEKDKMGPDSTMKYLETIGVNLEDASMFIVIEIVKAETIGEIKKDGFVSGWAEAGVDGSIASQKKHVSNLVAKLSWDKDLFKKVAKHAFVAGKEPDQRALALDNALLYWTMLFAPPGRPWYLREKWPRTVSRDMWNQTLLFAEKSSDDESLSFWNPEASWPNVIDDFVAWFKANRSQDGAMEVDQSA